jgi:hypothetical protein
MQQLHTEGSTPADLDRHWALSGKVMIADASALLIAAIVYAGYGFEISLDHLGHQVLESRGGAPTLID